MAPASGFRNEGRAGAWDTLSFECVLLDPGEQESVSLLLGARRGSLSLKKKGSMVLVLHQLRNGGLNSNTGAIRHRRRTDQETRLSEAEQRGQVASGSKPAPCSQGPEHLRSGYQWEPLLAPPC